MKETQLKAAEDSAKAWKSMADTVSGALSSQISGVINGTTTMKQAFSNMAKSMMEDAAKFALKWVTEHAFAVASNMAANNTLTAATLAGDAAKTASADRERRGRDRLAGRQRHRLDRHRCRQDVRRGVRLPCAAARSVRRRTRRRGGGDRSFRRRGVRHRRVGIAARHDRRRPSGRDDHPLRGGVADEFRGFLGGAGFGHPTAGASVQQPGSARGQRQPRGPLPRQRQRQRKASTSSSRATTKRSSARSTARCRHGSALGLRSFTP